VPRPARVADAVARAIALNGVERATADRRKADALALALIQP
jgi:hypothetical protein